MYYFHCNASGMPEEMTDAEGAIVWRARYATLGKLVFENVTDNAPSGFEQNLRMQGQYHDRETGLYYNTFRYYDCDTGRFISEDPIGLLGGMNLYQYAPNPLSWIDPWGWAKETNACGEYRNVGGHHVHAKASFRNTLAYDPKKGFSLGQGYMEKYKLKHEEITRYQRKAFNELARSGRQNTLAEQTQIARDALIAGGASKKLANKLVKQSLQNLAQQGISIPSHIPWY